MHRVRVSGPVIGWHRGLALAAAIALVSRPAPAQSPVARVTLFPEAVSVPASRLEVLTAIAWDSGGRPVPGVRYAFSSSAAAVATVDASGLVTAVSPGTTVITVTAGGRTAAITVTVRPRGGGRITRVEITPATSRIVQGATAQLDGVARDAQGRVSEAEWHLWNTDNPLVASVTSSGLVTGLAPGTARITMSSAGVSQTATVVVTGDRPSENVITIDTAATFQTMTGWQAAGQNGWLDCNPTAFRRYRDELAERLVNELGIERITTALRSGSENTRDYHPDYVAGSMPMAAYRDTWFAPVNDNADPLVTDSSKFFWGFLDGHVDNAVAPLRERMRARGEPLYWVLTYVDFLQGKPTKPFMHLKQPEEYAELVAMAFTHLQQKYGFVPNALELVLEPEHTTYTPAEVGRAMVAAAARLRALGFTPDLIGPSTTSVWNAAPWYDGMTQVRGASGLLDELSYHRYVALSYQALSAIGLRSRRDGVKVSMLEHIGADFDDLYEDLTVANASAWMLYSSAFCGRRDNPDAQGVYYQVNQTDPNRPKVNITNRSKLFRQLFAYVRRGAVRVGATSGNATDLLPLAFRNPGGSLVAVVRARRGSSFEIRGLPEGRYGINYGTPGARWNVDLADQTITPGSVVRASIPSDGVITIYAKGSR
jgi:hypothetical protein